MKLNLTTTHQEYVRAFVNSVGGNLNTSGIRRLIYNLTGTRPSGNGRVEGPPSKLSPGDPPAKSRDDLVNSNNMQPDLIIENRIFDVFTPRNPQAYAIYNNIAEKVSRGQTARVLLNLFKNPTIQAHVRKIEEVKAVVLGPTGPRIMQIWP